LISDEEVLLMRMDTSPPLRSCLKLCRGLGRGCRLMSEVNQVSLMTTKSGFFTDRYEEAVFENDGADGYGKAVGFK